MGEEVKKVEEEAKVMEQKKKEATAAVPEAEKKQEASAAEGEEKKEEVASKEPPPPPSPVILGIDLHCTGCANKIKRCILRCKGVEGVEVDMAQNRVMVKGIVDPHGICEHLRKRTMRNATVISPPPPPPPAVEEDEATAPKEEPVIVHSQVSEAIMMELLVHMHCDACAQQLKKKILKMRGVQSADANPGAGKLTVTGTMSADKLIQYIHRRTGKIATVVLPPLPPEPQKEEEPKKEEGDTKLEELPAKGADKEEQPAEDAVGGGKKEEEAAKQEGDTEKKDMDGGEDKEQAKPELVTMDGFPQEEMMYWPYHQKHYYTQAEKEARMAMVHPYTMPTMQRMPAHPPLPPPEPVAPPPMYQYYNYDMLEQPLPAPQYFSDENPNACVIS